MRTLIAAVFALFATLMAPAAQAQVWNGFDPRGGPSIPSTYSVRANPWNGVGWGGGWGGGWGVSPWAPWDGVGFGAWNETSSGRTKRIELPDRRKVRAQFCPRDADGRPIGWVMFGVSCTKQNAERFADLLYGAPAPVANAPQLAAASPPRAAEPLDLRGPTTLAHLDGQQPATAVRQAPNCRALAGGVQVCN